MLSIVNSVSRQSMVKPHFIDLLGEEGLTAKEIAQSLGVPIEAVHQKLRRGKWHSGQFPDFTAIAYAMTADEGTHAERTIQTFALSTNAAKAFVARWNNVISDGYLRFLFRCEANISLLEKAEKLAREAAKKYKDLAERVKQLELENLRLRGKRRGAKKDTVLVPMLVGTLFGQELQYHRVPKNHPNISSLAYKEGEIKMHTNCIAGAIKKIERLTAEIAADRRR